VLAGFDFQLGRVIGRRGAAGESREQQSTQGETQLGFHRRLEPSLKLN
jgi:hypothetical protein